MTWTRGEDTGLGKKAGIAIVAVVFVAMLAVVVIGLWIRASKPPSVREALGPSSATLHLLSHPGVVDGTLRKIGGAPTRRLSADEMGRLLYELNQLMETPARDIPNYTPTPETIVELVAPSGQKVRVWISPESRLIYLEQKVFGMISQEMSEWLLSISRGP